MKKQLKGEIVILSLFHFMHHLYGLSLPPLFPLLKNHFGIGNVQVGLVVSMISITMALFQIPLGLYSDKFGRKKILSVCFSIMLAAVLFTSISFAFWMILIFQIILGIGMSGYHPVGISAVADLFPGKEAGKAMSMQAIGGSLGVALAPILLGGLASFYGWRVPLRIIALAGIPLLLGIIFWMDEPKPEPEKERISFSLTYVTLAVALFYFFRGFVFKSITSFLPTYFVESRGLSIAGGGFTTSILLLSGVSILPFAGILTEKVDRVLLIVGSCLSSSLILFIMTLIPTVGWLMYLMLALFGLLIYLSLPSVLSLVKDLTSKERYGGAFGINFTMAAAAGVIAPVIVGYIGDVFSLALAFKLLPSLLVLASISIILIKNRI